MAEVLARWVVCMDKVLVELPDMVARKVSRTFICDDSAKIRVDSSVLFLPNLGHSLSS